MAGIVVTGSADRWQALSGAEVVGTLQAMIRPDQRCLLFFDGCHEDAYGPLVAAATAELDRDLYTIVDEDDGCARNRLADLGFTMHRHEHVYRIPVDAHGLTQFPTPAGIELISAADADLDRLRLLDDALRQDIPGSDGWRWRPEEFRAETFGSDFDPALYMVAVDRSTGAYVGLLRVWAGRTRPRLGCLAVLPAYRRTRVTHALVSTVARALHDHGHREIVTEISAGNRAALALLARRGAVRAGGSYELIRRRVVTVKLALY